MWPQVLSGRQLVGRLMAAPAALHGGQVLDHVVALQAVAEFAVVVTRAHAADDGQLPAAVLRRRYALRLLQQQRPISLHEKTYHRSPTPLLIRDLHPHPINLTVPQCCKFSSYKLVKANQSLAQQTLIYSILIVNSVSEAIASSA